jgi:hypothetical protein
LETQLSVLKNDTEESEKQAELPARRLAPTTIADRSRAYLDGIERGEIAPSITGLRIALGLWDWNEFQEYLGDPRYSPLMKKCRVYVENAYERQLLSHKGSPVGAIFALKNMGWRDTHDVSVTTGGLMSSTTGGLPPLPPKRVN